MAARSQQSTGRAPQRGVAEELPLRARSSPSSSGREDLTFRAPAAARLALRAAGLQLWECDMLDGVPAEAPTNERDRNNGTRT